ncbi:MAG: biotin--[acetyl-CoA-carboxylase] ligase [Sphingomonas fennica]
MIRVVAEAGSTNDLMADWARAGAGEGDWLVARRQTGGRGRDGRVWAGLDGNLFASGLVRLGRGDPPAQTLALVAGVAVAETVATWLPAGRSAMLKWPNDLLVDGAKLAGILIERAGDAAIVGIGINLAAAPEGAISLAALGGKVPDAASAAETLAGRFGAALGRWRAGGVARIASEWAACAHPVGAPLVVRRGTESVQGAFAGLTEGGALRLLCDGGEIVIHAGDVALR